MLLVISPSAKARSCAQTIQQATAEETHVAATLSQALTHLRVREYLVVLIDQAMLEHEPDDSETVLEHVGTAIPLPINFAINGMDRVVRELRSALLRHKREVQVARQAAHQALRNELKDTVTALLLSCEMALRVPTLPHEAGAKIRAAYELAQEVRTRLELKC